MSSGIEIKRLDQAGHARWDAFVLAAPSATFFHLAGWKVAIEQGFGHHCPYMMAVEEGEIVGILPLCRIRSRLFGHHLLSTAFAVYGGPVASSKAAEVALGDAATDMAKALGTDSLEYRTIVPVHKDWQTRSDTHATFRKGISGAPDDLLTAIPRKQRAVVRKALKRDLEIALDNDIQRFYPLYAESVRNLGTPVFPKRWFAALKAVFGNDCEIAIVLSDGQPVASLMSFYFRGEVLPYYAGGTRDARRLGAHDFMYYDLMCRAVERGCDSFDFGRSKTGSGAYAFKKNFGFEPEPLNYQYCLPDGGDLPDISPNNPKYRWMTAIWSKLPLPVANALGPMISRNLG
ncbi:MAG: FemAB family XrtA/PEP-CTERM system-associated protein [Alphaproteobacteria bacterium]